ncbi:MAG TPA: nuclear transport factor 2 family protein [Candidatus Thermoplasmatota archaeon]|nr:nuclear transport factor 2 family protein [Candidatus Thermoplasmatota archaeon]
MAGPEARDEGPEQVVRRLHDALRARDADAVAACYRPDARFQDPVFGELAPGEVRDMWRMLLARAQDLEVRTVDVQGTGGASASATTSFRYTLSWTGRRVHNTIHSAFVVQEGRITLQHDAFPFHAWAAQAFGWRGRLLGRSARLRRRVQRQARAGLQAFRARSAAGPYGATAEAKAATSAAGSAGAAGGGGAGAAEAGDGVPPGRVL